MPMLLAGKNGKGLLEMVIDVDCSDQQRLILIKIGEFFLLFRSTGIV